MRLNIAQLEVPLVTPFRGRLSCNSHGNIHLKVKFAFGCVGKLNSLNPLHRELTECHRVQLSSVNRHYLYAVFTQSQLFDIISVDRKVGFPMLHPGQSEGILI